jgi:hypothetical protein
MAQQQHTEHETHQHAHDQQAREDKTKRSAKQIMSPSEHEDHPGQTLATQNHDVIKQWAEERKATPATVRSEKSGAMRTLRVNFPGYGGENLEEIWWDEWFKPFDERHLTFVYQEHLKSGKPSNFFILDNPDREDG